VTLPEGSFAVGDEVVCAVDIGQRDRTATEAVFQLGYRNKHYCWMRSDDANDGTTLTPVTTTTWVGVHTLSVSLPSREPGRYPVTLVVPHGGPASVDGLVRWQVRARVVRARRPDHRVTRDVVVRNRRGMPPVPPTHYKDAFPAVPSVPMTGELRTRQLAPGESLAGGLLARPTEVVPVQELVVQLVRELDDRVKSRVRVLEARTAVTGAFTFRPGQPVAVPFEIALPEHALPSFSAENNSQHWYLEAVIGPAPQDVLVRVEVYVL
jgi:hypothetical protein